MKSFKLFIFFFYFTTFSCKVIDNVVEENDNDSFIIDEDLPAYYTKQYLSDKCKTITESIAESNDITDSFVFITDTHFEWNECHSGQLVNTIIKNTPVNKVIHGGDAGSEITKDYKAVGFSLLTDNVQKLSETLVDRIKPASFYSLRGNHDLNCKIDGNAFDGYPISYVRDVYLSFMPNVFIDKTDEDGFYYFFDNEKAKIRYIAIDTSYGSIMGTAKLGYRQLKWVLEKAIKTVPEDYSLVFLTHIPVSRGVDITTEYVRYSPLKEIIGAINNNRKGTAICDGNELEYDFSMITNRVLFVLSGHIHSDAQAYDDNVLYITTTCDRLSNDMVSQYEESYKQTRMAGDITEQAFDVVSFNNRIDGWIMMTRIGAGYSRFYNMGVIVLKMGETISLNDKLSSIDPIKWDANDAPGALGSWSSRNWTRCMSVLSVNNDLITAKNEGEAILFAEDLEHNKEFFLVKVVAS